MDYKSFNTKFEEIKEKVNKFINEKREKNMTRGEEIYETYVSSINKGDFSLKSFKAKIIHNELEHKKTNVEFNELMASVNEEINHLFVDYFNGYAQDVKSQTTSPTKGSDLSSYNSSARRKRQDIINRINNIEKDYNAKKKEEENKFSESHRNMTTAISESNRHLNLDLQRVNDATIAEYSEIERSLLDIDEVEQIKELKEQINSIRLKGLEEQKKLKCQYAIEMQDLKNQLAVLQEQYNYDMALLENQMREKKLENLIQKKLIDLDISEKSYIYDREYEKKCQGTLKNYRYNYLKYAIEHNNLLNNIDKGPENFYNFVIKLIHLYMAYLLVKSNETNFYDPLNKVIPLIDEWVNNLEETYNNLRSELDNVTTAKMDDIQKIFSTVVYDKEWEKRHPKDELLENIITSINRYYENIRIEADRFIMIIWEMIISLLKQINESKNEKTPGNAINYLISDENQLIIKTITKDNPLLTKIGYQVIEQNESDLLLRNEMISDAAKKIINYKSFIESGYHDAIKQIDFAIASYKANKVKVIAAHKKKNATEIKMYHLANSRCKTSLQKNISKQEKMNLHEYKKTLKTANKFYKYKRSVL